MKKLDVVIDPLASIKELCPEAFFQPQYPYIFRFNLILKGVDYGVVKIVVKEGLVISKLSGNKKALEKIEEIKKANQVRFFSVPAEFPPVFIDAPVYPLSQINQLDCLLKEEGIKKNGDYEKMEDFISHIYSPINTKLLYEKTGIEIQY